jgi:hypothetical protein
MSASDAAPLPRLGEVFFDVRGNSRSMRLSWYADTGVAVFSIWQGGVCTGTFRLPIDDLPRMVETLQRGPQGRRARPAPVGQDPYAEHDDYGERDEFGDGDPYAEGDPYDERGRYGDSHQYADAHPYPDGDPYGETTAISRAGGGRRQDYPSGGYSPDDDFREGYQYDRPGRDQFIDTAGGTDYGQERFVPPYVRSPADAYPNDNPGAPQYPEPRWSSAGYSGDPALPGWQDADERDLPDGGSRGRNRDYRGHRDR